ncbi:MAG TPA: TniB family NTP-binding protein [Streptosporangiaceae bacterium]
MTADQEAGDPEDLSHLHESTRRVARLPAAERLAHARADRWIGYTRAVQAVARLEELLAWPGNGHPGPGRRVRWSCALAAVLKGRAR